MNLPNQILEEKELPSSFVESIKYLWEDRGTQICFEYLKNDTDVNESLKYYIDSIERISKSDYVPSYFDIFNIPYNISDKTGVIKLDIPKYKCILHLIYVNNLKPKRKKWENCLDDISVVFFVVDISRYNEMSKKDNTTTCLQESINFFEAICNSEFYKNTPFIIFFNNTLRFKEKLKTSPFNNYFSDYRNENNENNENSIYYYIFDCFKRVNSNSKRDINIIVEFKGVNTINNIFTLIQDTIRRKNLRDEGFL